MKYIEKLLEFLFFQSIWKGIEMISSATLKFISDNLIFWIYIGGAIVLAVYMIASYIKRPSKSFIFSITNKIFPQKYDVLSADMKNDGRGHDPYKGDSLSWNIAAKLHINTAKPMTIPFHKCTAKLKHHQHDDIRGEFTNIVLIEKEYGYNEAKDDLYVYRQIRESKDSQIIIDKPSIITLLAMFETPAWKPGDKESQEILFKLPVSERNYKPLRISVEMLKSTRGNNFTNP